MAQKTFIGPRLRELRRQNNETQADMAKRLDVSPAYVNLLENNQRSLSVQILIAISEAYSVDLRDLTKDDSARILGELRHAFNDPTFSGDKPGVQEFRGAIDHAPRFVQQFLHLHQAHRQALDLIMRFGGGQGTDDLLQASSDGVILEFFRRHGNHFPALERAAEEARATFGLWPETAYVDLRDGLLKYHGIETLIEPIDQMVDTLREYDETYRRVRLSQALNTENRVFQLAHVLALVAHGDLLARLAREGGEPLPPQTAQRLQVELANYFAAAVMMPYQPFLDEAEHTRYDIDRIAARFGASFEQVCQRLTTLQQEGTRGVPFFFLRIDRAGNVTKRFNATSSTLAEHGGSCPVWNMHTAFHTPGVIIPQFVETAEGERFFTIARTVHRPVFSAETQDRRLTLVLGCAAEHAHRLRYSAPFNLDDPARFAQIGINCHVCPRQACSQRAHQPLFIDLPIDANRRGSTRYES